MRDSWREIELGASHAEYGDNYIKSSSDNVLTFLPSFALAQARRSVILWFVMISVLQLAFTSLHEWEPWSTIVFLAGVLLFSLVKSLARELKKGLSDLAANNSSVVVWRNHQFTEVKAKNLHAGEIVWLREGDSVPADLILLCSPGNRCFVKLQKLSGQIDPEEKQGLGELQIISENFEHDHSVVTRIEGTLEVPQPTADFNSFDGTLKLRGFPRGIKLTISNFLPRGASLTNTQWALGTVVYVGRETKTSGVGQCAPSKSSKLEQFVNLFSSSLILAAVLLSFLCAGLTAEMQRDDKSYSYGSYLVVFLLTYQRVVPITLYLVLEFVRLVLKLSTFKQCEVINPQVLDNLGHVEYVITGKSGVVTTGQAALKVCLLGSSEYWIDSLIRHDNEEIEDRTKIIPGTSVTYNATSSNHDSMFADFPDVSDHFLNAILLCHSKSVTKAPFESVQSSALAEGARSLGYSLSMAGDHIAVLRTAAGERTYEVVFTYKEEAVIYVVVKSTASDKSWLYVSGLIQDIRKYYAASEDDMHRLSQIDMFTLKRGLRPVVISGKELTTEATVDFRLKVESAKAGVVNAQGRIAAALAEITGDIKLLGTACLQDELASGIADTVTDMSRFGASVWLASSEDQYSVMSCGLHLGIISPSSQLLVLTNVDSTFQLKRTLIKGIRRYVFDSSGMLMSAYGTMDPGRSTPRKLNLFLNLAPPKVPQSKLLKSFSIKGGDLDDILQEDFDPEDVNFSVLIDGMTLATAVRDPECRMLLTCCLFPSNSVLGFDFMPMQKADLCRLLQENLAFKPVVLAIGEGEKDGPLLKTAQIGCSIKGMCSSDADIVISDFHSLCWLVSHSGKQVSGSLARMMCLALYKNLAFTLALFYYNFLCDLSGTQLYSSLLAAGLDLLFTILPLTVSVFDPAGKHFKLTRGLAAKYVLKSLGHSALVFIYAVSVSNSPLDADGTTMTVTAFGLLVYAALMLAFYLQLLLETKRLWLYAVSACVISAGMMFLCLAVAFPYEFVVVSSSPPAMLALFFSPLSCLAFSLVCRFITKARRIKVFPLCKTKSRLEPFSKSIGKVYRDSRGWKSSDEHSAYDIDPVRLRFISDNSENIYALIRSTASLTVLRLFLAVTAPLVAVWLLLIYFIQALPVALTIYRAVLSVLLLAALGLTFTKLKRFGKTATEALTFIGLVLMFVFVLIEQSQPDTGFAIACVLVPLIFFFDFVRVVLAVILSLVFAQVSNAVIASYDDAAHMSILFLQQLVILLSISVLALAGGYFLERNTRERFRLAQITKLAVEKSQAILSFLLPAFVKDRVAEGARYIAEDQGTVSILFCDIYDFDRICDEYSPAELTAFLDDLFRKLDYLCDAHGVTKIETVNKTYMACAGLRDSEADLPSHLANRSHARRVTDMALDIIRTCNTRKLKFGAPLQVKIGLNSGPVTAGVVGYHKPQFSLVGDTVNTAARMCSTIQVTNGIQMTIATFELIGDLSGLAFTDSSVEAKGKGLLSTKLVTEDLHFIAPAPVVGDGLPSQPKRASRAVIKPDNQEIRRLDTEMIDETFALTCKETPKQAKFRLEFLARHMVLIKLGIFVGFVLNFSLGGLDLAQVLVNDSTSTVAEVVCRGAVAMAYVSAGLLPAGMYKRKEFSWVTTALAIAHALVLCIDLMADTDEPHSLVLIEAMYVMVFWSNCSGCFILHILIVNCVILLLWLFLAPWVSSPLDFVGQSISLSLVMTCNIWVAYSRENSSRDFANLTHASNSEIDRTEKLVTKMMPARVYENLKNDCELTEKITGVSLLFADIVGFTAWSSDKQPVEVVGMLSELFTRFDRMTVDFKVYKVHTIGDCYVVMNDTSLSKRSPAEECWNMVEFGFAMLEAIRDINEEHSSQLNMRIGVHFGELIAGITGTNIVRYDIYGPDVLIANKMESGGQAGRLNVSDVVQDMLLHIAPLEYDYEFNAEIQAKSVNRKNNSYFITKKTKVV
jgi:magnesium-transporting ATPase (P-type)/class 3 adenylate cyclase